MANHTITFLDLKNVAAHASAIATPGTGSSWATLVNDALQYMAMHRNWSWRLEPLVLNISATANSAAVRLSNVVTITSASHGLAVGDGVAIISSTATTNTFNGSFVIASVPTSNTFTFAQSGADETATAAGSHIPAHINLPSDFASMHVLQRASTWKFMAPVSMEKVMQYRTGLIASITEQGGFVYAIGHRKQASVTAQPLRRLELFPAPSAAETGAFTGQYARIIPKMTGDTDLPDCPAQFHPVLDRIVRAMAKDREEQDSTRAWDEANRMLALVAAEDCTQTNLGPMEGGIEGDVADHDARLYPTRIGV